MPARALPRLSVLHWGAGMDVVHRTCAPNLPWVWDPLPGACRRKQPCMKPAGVSCLICVGRCCLDRGLQPSLANCVLRMRCAATPACPACCTLWHAPHAPAPNPSRSSLLLHPPPLLLPRRTPALAPAPALATRDDVIRRCTPRSAPTLWPPRRTARSPLTLASAGRPPRAPMRRRRRTSRPSWLPSWTPTTSKCLALSF